MPSARKCNCIAGFTIIEILVVIAVIGILAGILLPVLFAARESVRAAKCQSNLKQLYIAFELYTFNWDGVLPCPGGQEGDLSYWAQEQDGGGIDPYLKNQDKGGESVYCCPSYTGVHASKWSPRTYSMNSYLRTPWDYPFPVCLKFLDGIRKTNILQPEHTILLFEGMPESKTNNHGEGYVYRCADWTFVRGFDDKKKHFQHPGKPWHRGRNHYLFCDGHVETLTPGKHPKYKGPTSPDNDPWHVDKQNYRVR